MSIQEFISQEFNDSESLWQNESLMKRLYVKDRHSVEDISEAFGCSPATVSRWLNRHGIESRQQETFPKLRDSEYLEERYVNRKLSTLDIANELGCSGVTVSNWLDKHGIESRDRGDELDDRLRNEAKMREFYHQERMKIKDIANKLGCCNCTVRKFLSKHDIECRDAKFQPGEDHFNWAGGHEKYYGPNWESQKRKAKERDGYECLLCGMSEEKHLKELGERIHVHHIRKFRRYNSYKEANVLDNLATVCKDCHYDVEKYSPIFPLVV